MSQISTTQSVSKNQVFNMLTNDIIEDWKEKSFAQLHKKKRDCLYSRSDIITKCVNETLSKTLKEYSKNITIKDFKSFVITDEFHKQTLEKFDYKLSNWSGVNLNACKAIPKTFGKYHKIADNWWNRQKGVLFGEYYFWPLFLELMKYCQYIGNKLFKDKICIIDTFSQYLFSECWKSFGEKDISFKQSRHQPLLFAQSLEKSKNLKLGIYLFGKQHNLIWEQTRSNASNKSKLIRDSYRIWLNNISKKIKIEYKKILNKHNNNNCLCKKVVNKKLINSLNIYPIPPKFEKPKKLFNNHRINLDDFKSDQKSSSLMLIKPQTQTIIPHNQNSVNITNIVKPAIHIVNNINNNNNNNMQLFNGGNNNNNIINDFDLRWNQRIIQQRQQQQQQQQQQRQNIILTRIPTPNIIPIQPITINNIPIIHPNPLTNQQTPTFFVVFNALNPNNNM